MEWMFLSGALIRNMVSHLGGSLVDFTHTYLVCEMDKRYVCGELHEQSLDVSLDAVRDTAAIIVRSTTSVAIMFS